LKTQNLVAVYVTGRFGLPDRVAGWGKPTFKAWGSQERTLTFFLYCWRFIRVPCSTANRTGLWTNLWIGLWINDNTETGKKNLLFLP
jgi:hypothetical protein